MDLYFFNLINGFAGKWVCLDGLAIFFAKYFEYFLLLFLAVFLIVHPIKLFLLRRNTGEAGFNRVNFKKYWKMVFVALVSGVISRFVITSLIRLLWFRPRPFVSNSVNLILSHNPNEGSFPSGHAAFYFALSTVIYLYNKKIGILFYIASFLIVLARVFVGIHWPSDILAGALIGILIGWLTNKIFNKYFFKKN